MESSVTEALEIVREMSVQKMINFNFITKEQLDEYMRDEFLRGLENEKSI
jgi:hypothetical protein